MSGRAASPFAPRVATFLVAEVISAIGSFASMIEIWAYAAYQYDASPAQIALYGAAFSAPGVVLGPVSGVVIDRIGPRSTLLGAKLLGVFASIALLYAHDFRTLTVLSALHGVGAAFAMPALGSLPPRIVADAHLARTNALVGLTEQLAIVLGPVAAGVAIGAFGFKGAFIFDGCTYALGILVLPLLRLRPIDGGTAHDTEHHVLRDIKEGWRIVARTPLARRIVIATFTIHLLYGTSLLAEPLYVRDVLHKSTSVFAALQSVFGVFLVLAGLAAARIGDRMASFKSVAGSVALSGITAILYLTTSSVVIAFIGVALWGLASAIIFGPSRTVLQRATPETAHGRVMATDQVAGNLAMFLGLGASGVAVTAVGVRTTLLVLGAFVFVAGLSLGAIDRRDSARSDHREAHQGEHDPDGLDAIDALVHERP